VLDAFSNSLRAITHLARSDRRRIVAEPSGSTSRACVRGCLGCQARIAREGELEVEITRESYEAYYNEHPQERRARDERRRLAQAKG
jgi:hypothetical protein